MGGSRTGSCSLTKPTWTLLGLRLSRTFVYVLAEKNCGIRWYSGITVYVRLLNPLIATCFVADLGSFIARRQEAASPQRKELI